MEYLTIFKDLPTQIKALTIKNRDDSYTVILNSRLSYEQQRQSFLHELQHITNYDLEKECDIDELEYMVHYGGNS
jgi:Zn-dependent peptidase ImmA (M78 family)